MKRIFAAILISILLLWVGACQCKKPAAPSGLPCGSVLVSSPAAKKECCKKCYRHEARRTPPTGQADKPVCRTISMSPRLSKREARREQILLELRSSDISDLCVCDSGACRIFSFVREGRMAAFSLCPAERSDDDIVVAVFFSDASHLENREAMLREFQIAAEADGGFMKEFEKKYACELVAYPRGETLSAARSVVVGKIAPAPPAVVKQKPKALPHESKGPAAAPAPSSAAALADKPAGKPVAAAIAPPPPPSGGLPPASAASPSPPTSLTVQGPDSSSVPPTVAISEMNPPMRDQVIQIRIPASADAPMTVKSVSGGRRIVME